ncbi:MBL fold metallo-hydrolase [Entomohabitans teleogrylli]|uniref:MBL fold metallo-hydrolase n=1 Tax=Entomohabitans teleogrylli TaxID=1384589 RepID=UPI00073D4C93|nr:MBL fold metallo-hydrolase [Entomohabitans teleogrylli]
MGWKNPWYNPLLAHHRPQGFANFEPGQHGPGDARRWHRERREQKLPAPPQGGYAQFIENWWQPADLSHQGDGVWWLGHAALMLRLNGITLLTDPVFSRRASPFSFYGPERKTPVALDLSCPEALPDAVVISHNHYDHLDSRTLRRLRHRCAEMQIFVPLGLKRWFVQRGMKNVFELDWWQSVRWRGLTLTCVPARHWSMRTPWDRNRSLWCGWVIESDNQRFWFSGDTAWMPELLEIPRRVGPLDAAALPIGAYAPRWFMSTHHIDPQNAVRLWQGIGRPLAVPIHWGVFELADESLDAPVFELNAALRNAGEEGTRFSPIKIGEFIRLDKK